MFRDDDVKKYAAHAQEYNHLNEEEKRKFWVSELILPSLVDITLALLLQANKFDFGKDCTLIFGF